MARPTPNTPALRLALYASGGGTTAQALMAWFHAHPQVQVVGVLCNRRQAGVHHRALWAGVPTATLAPAQVADAQAHLDALAPWQPDALVLAGYLKPIPPGVLAAFPHRVVNTHPSLLPLFGGPGMYGHHVHQAVAQAAAAGQVTETGFTFHEVTAAYDEGPILHQHRLALSLGSDAATIQALVQAAERRYLPQCVAEWALGQPLTPLF